jgi:hypothetical protein
MNSSNLLGTYYVPYIAGVAKDNLRSILNRILFLTTKNIWKHRFFFLLIHISEDFICNVFWQILLATEKNYSLPVFKHIISDYFSQQALVK